jgi:hypothetical protein
LSESFERFVETLQKLGFRLVGVWEYSQLAEGIRDKCASPPCSVGIELPVGRSEVGSGYAIVVELRVAANTNRRIRKIVRCNGRDVIIKEEAIQVV